MEDEEALVCPGAESLTPVGLTCTWDKGQLTPGGGCMTLTAPAAGISAQAMSDIAWQIRYLNGGPANGPTTGDRQIMLTVTDTAGATGAAAMSLTVLNAPLLAGRCPIVTADQAVDVTAQMLAGGAGVRIAPTTLVTHPLGNATSVNAHVRIVSGCVTGQDLLGAWLHSALLRLFTYRSCPSTLEHPRR